MGRSNRYYLLGPFKERTLVSDEGEGVAEER